MKILFVDGIQKTLHCDNKNIALTTKEFLMLEFLLNKRKHRCIPIEEIINHVWNGRGSTIGKGNISQLSYRLRNKLSIIGNTIQISISMNGGGRCKVHRNTITIITTNDGILYSLLKLFLNINRGEVM
ncbi:winged helix-turn-helix domain-containing protein [Enterobacillus tribolii]|uniref:Transcriptional regulator n=1 Tax=Enterobacillus tribolii TaxID=1487935 RepID=A0A370R243_9GAMM|nr:transcriptional regulator [Enterobacillus tribolii]